MTPWCNQTSAMRRCRYHYDPMNDRCVARRSPFWRWLTDCSDVFPWCNDYYPPLPAIDDATAALFAPGDDE